MKGIFSNKEEIKKLTTYWLNKLYDSISNPLFNFLLFFCMHVFVDENLKQSEMSITLNKKKNDGAHWHVLFLLC